VLFESWRNAVEDGVDGIEVDDPLPIFESGSW
jgi:hypothetical protein